jgi:hypothetical protein
LTERTDQQLQLFLHACDSSPCVDWSQLVLLLLQAPGGVVAVGQRLAALLQRV